VNTHEVPAPQHDDDGPLAERFKRVRVNDEVSERLSFGCGRDGGRQERWLVNIYLVQLVRDFMCERAGAG
jgi:hypothetical protein